MTATGKNEKSKKETNIDTQCINTIRAIAAELPTLAKSGHPGAPLGCAPIAFALYAHVLKLDPSDPSWPWRDRFILSNGHASALLYTILALIKSGPFDVPKLATFRQLHSICPGHPELEHPKKRTGVEATTGPLGQGIAQGVGQAIATQARLKWLKHKLAKSKLSTSLKENLVDLFNSRIYVLCGDGCLQEGISYEVTAIAGHLKLSSLTLIYDSNDITIDGPKSLAWSENVENRFKAANWNVWNAGDIDKNGPAFIQKLQETGKRNSDKPLLVIVKTVIGFGSSLAGSCKAHGSPLSSEVLAALKNTLGVSKESLHVPEKVTKFFEDKRTDWKSARNAADAVWKALETADPEMAEEIMRRVEGRLPKNVKSLIENIEKATPSGPLATRVSSGNILKVFAEWLDEMVGGAADLATSCGVMFDEPMELHSEGTLGRYIPWGIREHGMFGCSLGISEFGFFFPFVATFLNFLTYGWPSFRLAAFSRAGLLCIMTHDSIELGEDGPTHQPIEVLSLLRSTPNSLLIRPGDFNEVLGGYMVWLCTRFLGPTVMSLSRGACESLPGSSWQKVFLGGYEVEDFGGERTNSELLTFKLEYVISRVCGGPAESLEALGASWGETIAEMGESLENGKGVSEVEGVILGASGTEVNLVLKAAGLLRSLGYSVRVVSMPCWGLYRLQSEAYREKLLCLSNPRVVRFYVEASHTLGYEAFFDYTVCMTTFGGSAPAKELQEHFGFTPEKIASFVQETLKKR